MSTRAMSLFRKIQSDAKKKCVTAISTLWPAKYSPKTITNSDITPGKPVRLYDSSGFFADYSTEDIFAKKQNRFLNWTCFAGVDNLRVGFNGDIHGAACEVGGNYGNAYDHFSLPQRPVKCNIEMCACGADLFIPKAKTENDFALLRCQNRKSSQVQKRKPALETFVAVERTFAGGQKQVLWELGRRCNFDCSYCSPLTHNHNDRHRTLEELTLASQKILEKFSPHHPVNFIVTGGEPTLNPNLVPWLQHLHSKGHKLSLHSNGTKSGEYYRDLLTIADLNLSVHFEFYRKSKLLEVVQKIVSAKKQGQLLHHFELKIMMISSRREEALQLESELLSIPDFTSHCAWSFVPVRTLSSEMHLRDDYVPEDFAELGFRG